MYWAKPDQLAIHPTVMMVLNQAGKAAYPAEEIERALKESGLSMVRYG